MNTNSHKLPDSELTEDSESAKGKGHDTKKFRLCGTGVGLGLLAVLITAPIWGIFGPPFISMFSPLLATAFSVVVPVAAFSVVLWKICSKQSNDN